MTKFELICVLSGIILCSAILCGFFILRYVNMRDVRIFSDVYKTNEWTNGSGPGSHPDNVKPYMALLQQYFDDPRFKTIDDLGCGDFQFMKLIHIPEDKLYTGYDLVPSVIEANKEHFGKSNVKFDTITRIEDLKDKSGDMIIVKDVMIHWSNERVWYFINNILPNYKYALLTNNFEPQSTLSNSDIYTGSFRPIDISQGPFNVKNLELVLEYESHGINKKTYLYTNPTKK
jgi:hypothetical protein